MSQAHVVVVEDEPKLAALLADYLREAGVRSTVVDRGDAALDAIRTASPDLVLLDIMLPGLDGLSVLRELRAFSRVPVIMLTARVEEVDRILGLELGADDYVCKPFSPREVIARVRAHLRRMEFESAGGGTGAAPPPGPRVALAADEMRARVDDRPVDLTPVEFRLLEVLLGRPGRVFSREALMNAAYRDHRIVSDRTIDTHVKNLRRKLGEALGGEAPIDSVYGVGYRWEPRDDADAAPGSGRADRG